MVIETSDSIRILVAALIHSRQRRDITSLTRKTADWCSDADICAFKKKEVVCVMPVCACVCFYIFCFVNRKKKWGRGAVILIWQLEAPMNPEDFTNKSIFFFKCCLLVLKITK